MGDIAWIFAYLKDKMTKPSSETMRFYRNLNSPCCETKSFTNPEWKKKMRNESLVRIRHFQHLYSSLQTNSVSGSPQFVLWLNARIQDLEKPIFRVSIP